MYWQLISNVLLMYGILVVVNIPAPFLGLQFENDRVEQRHWFEPPGWVIPIVWFVLFTLLGIARYVLTKQGDNRFQGYAIVGFAVLCATYAYYTLGLSQLTGIPALWLGLWGNLAVIIAATILCWLLYNRSATATLLVAPVIAWTLFATFIIVGKLKLQGLV
ncbi:MAG TPA: TspO/MBR family protein [Flavisolibacter sp.]|nr:TspO/MBR family protein [Flavisolibacter sp.]